MPEVCRQIHLEAEWRCFFGPTVYPTITSEQPPMKLKNEDNRKHSFPPPTVYVVSGSGPTFVVQYLFDQAQLMLNNADVTGHRMTEGRWNYIHSLGQESKNMLQNMTDKKNTQ